MFRNQIETVDAKSKVVVKSHKRTTDRHQSPKKSIGKNNAKAIFIPCAFPAKCFKLTIQSSVCLRNTNQSILGPK